MTCDSGNLLLRHPIVFFTFVISCVFITLQYNDASAQILIQVWLVDVNPNTGKVQVCIDVPDTGASSCRKFDASASRKDSLGKSNEPIVIDGGIYSIPSSNVLNNSKIIGCVYVFKSDTGYCSQERNIPTNETYTMLLFTKVKPVYYDKDAGRLYKYGECYKNEDSSKICVEDEGVAYPDMRKSK